MHSTSRALLIQLSNTDIWWPNNEMIGMTVPSHEWNDTYRSK